MQPNLHTLANPAVSTVIPCRNEVKHIEACLRSLLAQEQPPGGFEVIVADGMSDDGTRGILDSLAARDSRLRVVDNPSRITPCGMNCGIRAARGSWIAIMGAHNHYAPDYLRRCLEAAQTTGADAVGGAMFTQPHTFVQRAIAAAHHSPFSVGGARWHNPNYEGPADTVFGGFYHRRVFENIGFFDEELVRNQDDEFNLRLTKAGGTIWHCPKIKSWYSPRSSLPALFRQYAQYGYWKVRVIQKHAFPASWRHLVPGAFVLSLMVLGLCSMLGLFMAELWPLSLPFFRMSTISLLVLLVSYLTGNFFASATTAIKNTWSLFPLLPPVFACYHLGYGFGFLRGCWDFVLRRRPGIFSPVVSPLGNATGGALATSIGEQKRAVGS